MKFSFKIKKVFAFAFLSAALASAFCNDFQNQGKGELWSLSFSPYAGIRNGVQQEFVFVENVLGENAALSELNWDMKNLYLAGINAKGKFYGVFVEAGFKSALTVKCGTIADSDWSNVEGVSPLDEKYFYKTHYSEHDNNVKSYYELSIKAGYDFNLSEKITVSPFVQLEYWNSDFLGQNGTGWYVTSGNYPYTQWETYGTKNDYTGQDVIRLERIVYSAWAGFSFKADVNDRFSLLYGFAFCPYINVKSLDSHFTRNRYFYDEMDKVSAGMRFNMAAEFNFNSYNKIYFKAEYLKTGTATGTTKYSTQRDGYFSLIDDSSGAAFQWAEFSLGYTLSFRHPE